MRYLIETKEDEAVIGSYLAKLNKDGKILLIEKGDPLETLKVQQHRIQRALELLNKAGINREVLVAFIQSKLPGNMKSKATIEAILDKQEEFYEAIGISFK